MKRLLLTLALLSAALTSQADTPPFAYYPGSTLSVIWDTGTKSDLVEGSSTQAGTYKATNAELVTDGLAGAAPGTVRYGRIFEGVTAASVAPTDNHVGNLVIRWTGAATVDEWGELEDSIESAAGGTQVDADVVDDTRTWFADGRRARNIVEVQQNFTGTLAVQPKINPNTTILTVSAVSITGAATVTATDFAVNRSKTRAHFDVPALATTGTYTVKVTVITVDSQTIVTTCTLRVY